MLRNLATSLLRFDARSLGLFRVAMGLTLIFDLMHRWDWIRAFYSNEGVLPNHNHLFQLKEGTQVWSIYHSFSSVEENTVAFLLTFFFYACFTLGWHTRAFHVLSLVCLIGLSGRNTLAESIGNSVGIAVMFVTVFLPLGLRFSVDSLRRSFADFDEHTPSDLNERSRPQAPQMTSSLVPLATLGVIALILMGVGLQHNGHTWKDGSALYFALHVDRWTSGLGEALRGQWQILDPWTVLYRHCELAVVPLALIPVGRLVTRPLAIAALLVVGLTVGMLFTLGLYGWTLAACALLLVPNEVWSAITKPTRPTVVYYDDDCGMCLWCARLAKRLDLRGNLTFAATSDVTALPDGITAEMVERSMVTIDDRERIHTDIDAMADVMRAVWGLWWLGLLVRLPVIKSVARRLYFKVADNRLDISVAVGMGACGVPDDADVEASAGDSAPTPAQRTWMAARAFVSSGGALAVLLCVWAQSERHNSLPVTTSLGERDALVSLATWSRVLAPWDLWAPNPPLANEGLVTVAEVRTPPPDLPRVDVLTGHGPDEDLKKPRLARRGVLWSAYTASIADQKNQLFRKELRRYLTKGGYGLDTRNPNNYIRHLAVYWVTDKTPPPGEARPAEQKPVKVEILAQRGRVGPKRPRVPFPRTPRPRP